MLSVNCDNIKRLNANTDDLFVFLMSVICKVEMRIQISTRMAPLEFLRTQTHACGSRIPTNKNPSEIHDLRMRILCECFENRMPDYLKKSILTSKFVYSHRRYYYECCKANIFRGNWTLHPNVFLAEVSLKTSKSCPRTMSKKVLNPSWYILPWLFSQGRNLSSGLAHAKVDQLRKANKLTGGATELRSDTGNHSSNLKLIYFT